MSGHPGKIAEHCRELAAEEVALANGVTLVERTPVDASVLTFTPPFTSAPTPCLELIANPLISLARPTRSNCEHLYH
jgi:hypothetical protein